MRHTGTALTSRQVLAAVFLAASLSGGPTRAWSHDDPNASVPSLRALKVDSPLVVDGVLDEPFWSECPVSTGFIDQRSRQPADQQTTVRVAYTRTHVYVAIECLDDHIEEVRATERREDRFFQGDDWVEVHFDPPHNHRGKYAFFSNPLGTRADANEGPSGVFNYGWSAEWQLAAKTLADRWVFEMSIPLKVMNYYRRNGQAWGFNVTRLLRRTDTLSFWSFSATEMYKPRHFGHLTGLDLGDAVFDLNWEFTPYASTRTDFNGDTDTFFKGGLDVNVRLTPSITTAWTFNPDFGQIEADDDTIELRDTERFLPEKRLFFREGDELMRMPYQLYYSRRLTDIDAGMKVSGLMRGASFAFLNVQGDIAHDGRFYGNSSVLRVLQDIKERSSIGYYLSDSELEEGHSRVGGADGYFFLTDAWRFRFQAAVSEDRLEDSTGANIKNRWDYLGTASVIYSRYPWDFSVSYNALSEDFNPMLAYIPRRDIFGPALTALYSHDSANSWYKRLTVSYRPELYENAAGETVLRDHFFSPSIVFPNDLGLRLGCQDAYHKPFHNRRYSAGLDLWASDYYRSVNLTWAAGVFEEVNYHELTLGKRYNFIERLPIRHEFTVRFEDRPDGRAATVWLNRVIFDLFMSDRMWLKASLQHRNNGIRNFSIIWGWRVWRKTHWYIVFNNVNDGASDGSSVFTKITYTF